MPNISTVNEAILQVGQLLDRLQSQRAYARRSVQGGDQGCVAGSRSDKALYGRDSRGACIESRRNRSSLIYGPTPHWLSWILILISRSAFE
jgi:hypothetical protein